MIGEGVGKILLIWYQFAHTEKTALDTLLNNNKKETTDS